MRFQARAGAWALLGRLAFLVGYFGSIVFVAVGAANGRLATGDVLLTAVPAGQVLGLVSGSAEAVKTAGAVLATAGTHLELARAAEASRAGIREDAPVPGRLERGLALGAVSYRYPHQDRDVPAGIDLELPAGSTVAAVGENGAGKSTLVKLLAGLYVPAAGRITADGVDLSRILPEQWRSRVTAAFQDHARYELTLDEAVGLGGLAVHAPLPDVLPALSRGGAALSGRAYPSGGCALGAAGGPGVGSGRASHEDSMDAARPNRAPSRPNAALGEFLRSRRARLLPQEVGLRTGRRRRVEGLRREELASLAGVSVEYYTRLEQGRHAGASAGVLDALAAALRLSHDERSYLHRLAGPGEGRSPDVGRVRPETVRLMRALDPTPAVLLGHGMDVLGSNEGGRRLYTDFTALPTRLRNAVHWMLSDPGARDLHAEDWMVIAAEMVGMLRLRTGRGPRDARVGQIVDDLTASSAFFREVWQERTVSVGARPVKRFLHPEAGPIEMSVESLQVAHAEGQLLVVLVPEPGSPDERAWHSVMARPASPQP